MPIARASRDWECAHRHRRRVLGGCFEAKEVSAHRVVQRSTDHEPVVARGKGLGREGRPEFQQTRSGAERQTLQAAEGRPHAANVHVGRTSSGLTNRARRIDLGATDSSRLSCLRYIVRRRRSMREWAKSEV